MTFANRFAEFADDDPRLELLARPETGIVIWRPRNKTIEEVSALLPTGLASQTTIAGETWFRCVAANPVLQIDQVIAAVKQAL